MIQIKLIKDTELHKIGDILNCSKKDAESYVSNGYGEYFDKKQISKPKKIKKIKKEIIEETKPKETKENLSDLEIIEKVKEIAKMESPLEINKQLKEIVNNSNYNLQTLQKQLNYIKRGMGEKGVTLVTDDTDVTNVTDVTNELIKPCVTFVIRNTPFPDSLFGDSVLDKIIEVLIKEKRAITFGEIALKINKSESQVKNTISKNSQYFGKIKPNGKICYTYLLRMIFDELQIKIDAKKAQIKQKEEQEKRHETEQNQAKNKHEILMQEFKNFFELIKSDLKLKSNIVKIDFSKITELALPLEDALIRNPKEAISVFEQAIEDLGIIKHPVIRIFNLPNHLNLSIEQIRPKNVDSLISLNGRVITLSDIRPQCIEAQFECPICGTIIQVSQDERKFKEPKRCSCGRKGGFKLISKETTSSARLILEDLSEKTDNPHSKRLNCLVKGDLLNYDLMSLYNPGNEVELVGIVKEIPISLKEGGISTRSEYIFEVISVINAKEEIEADSLSDDDIENINILANKINDKGLDELVSSFAPDIYGYDYVKKAIILQLAAKKNEFGSNAKINKPNILLIGDPGTAKTFLGEFAVSITLGARKSVGGSASAVGFTGAVVRDEYSGGWRLEPGAIVLAKDFFMIDELNNVRDEDKPRLQEALSEHTITIDKATIHTKLSAPAGVLATANPIHGLFKENEDLVKQFNLSPPIINRFDIIFAVRDEVNEAKDMMIAKKMNERDMNKINVKYSPEFLKKFFVYIKNQPEPKMTEEISNKMAFIYSKLRRYKTDSLNINPRVHKAFQLLCRASARIRLANKVEEKDIEMALEILNQSYFKIPPYKFFKEEIDKRK